MEVFEGLIDFGDPEARGHLGRGQFVVQRQTPQLGAEARIQPDLLTVGLDTLPERWRDRLFGRFSRLQFPTLVSIARL